MIEYDEFQNILENLTIYELEYVKNSLADFLKEKYIINKLDDYEFIDSNIKAEDIKKCADYRFKMGILKYGTDEVEELVNEIIEEKKDKIQNIMFDFNNLQGDIIHIIHWSRLKKHQRP